MGMPVYLGIVLGTVLTLGFIFTAIFLLGLWFGAAQSRRKDIEGTIMRVRPPFPLTNKERWEGRITIIAEGADYRALKDYATANQQLVEPVSEYSRVLDQSKETGFSHEIAVNLYNTYLKLETEGRRLRKGKRFSDDLRV